MVASKNDQVCKVSHIILYTRHTSHGNTTQLDNIIENVRFYSDGKTISNGTSLGLQIA